IISPRSTSPRRPAFRRSTVSTASRSRRMCGTRSRSGSVDFLRSRSQPPHQPCSRDLGWLGGSRASRIHRPPSLLWISPPGHVIDRNMSWSGKGGYERRGYHHGNLREALIDAALMLLAEKGPDGFTIAEVARLAGVSSAAPYRHFRDADALLAAVAERGYERFAAVLA